MRHDFECGCGFETVDNSEAWEFHWCSEHKAAPDMYKALRLAIMAYKPQINLDSFEPIKQALAKAEGKEAK